MNLARRLLPLLGVLTVAGLLAVVWQAQTIARLRAELAAVKQDLRHYLSVSLTAAPASVPDRARQDQLELIKLRHEARELRESLVEARAAQPAGLKGLLQPLRPSPPVKLRPEWQGMEQHATNNYARVMQGVTNGTNAYMRYIYLPGAAKMSLALGRTEEARHFAEDALTLNDKHSRGVPEEANGEVIHDANLVLGRIAVAEGRLEDAKRHLLQAGRTRGSPVLGSFGPNMGLAKDLLERGEQGTVLEYFELCRKFWSKTDTLDTWRKDVEAGRIPDFRDHLIL